MSDSIADAIKRMRERIVTAAIGAGRDPNEITLVAVTKKQSVESVIECLNADITNVGENYIQEGIEKRRSVGLEVSKPIAWHFQGHLQSNKAEMAVDNFDLIQSVDSLKLAQVIGKYAAAKNTIQPILLQVHLGNEATKFGLAPEIVGETAATVGEIEGISLRGLMGIAPFGEDARPYFQILSQLYEKLPPTQRQILSMGMTGDFEIAIEHGATMVRIGTGIFGAR